MTSSRHFRSARTVGSNGAPPSGRRAVAIAALLTAPAIAIRLLSADAALAFDPVAVAGGEVWRVITGHWTHWSFDHLLWDTIAFAVLLFLALRRGAGRTFAVLGLAAVSIPFVVAWLRPDLATYRGLSGLDSALYVLVGGDLLRERFASRRWGESVLVALALVAFAAKIVVEARTGTTVFADSAAFVPVPLAHAVGGLCGLVTLGLGRGIAYPGRVAPEATTTGPTSGSRRATHGTVRFRQGCG